MVEKIQKVLEKNRYKQISSNLPFVTIHVYYEENSARVVQLIDCEDEIRLTVSQFVTFCDKAVSFIKEKGYEEVEMISIVVARNIVEAKKFILCDDNCWIIDSQNERMVVFENQPNDFYGLKGEIESVLNTALYKTDDDYYYSQSSVDSRRTILDEFTPVNTAFVLANVVIFFVMSILGSTEDVDFMINHGAMYVPYILDKKEIYRLFTCMFQHFGFMHMAGNMVVLLFLGDNVERAVGRIRYPIIYILGGLIGSIGSFLFALVYNKNIVSAGASGAIFALIGALLWLVICNKGRLEDMTTLKVCILIAYALYNGFISENVDMAAHLFGLIGGFVIAFIVYRRPDSNSN